MTFKALTPEQLFETTPTVATADRFKPSWMVYFYASKPVFQRQVFGTDLESSVGQPSAEPFPWNEKISDIRVDLTSTQTRLAEATILVENVTDDLLSYRYLRHGSLLRIHLGHADHPLGSGLGPVFYGRVSRLQISYEDGKVVLEITASDAALDLLASRVSVNLPPGTSSGEAITSIARWFHITVFVAPDPPILSVDTYVDADLAWFVITRIAEKVGWKVWYQDNFLSFSPNPAAASASLLLEHGGGQANVFDVKFVEDRVASPTASEVASIDDSTGTVISGSFSEPGASVFPEGKTPDEIRAVVGQRVRQVLETRALKDYVRALEDPQAGEVVLDDRFGQPRFAGDQDKGKVVEGLLTEYYTRTAPSATSQMIYDDLRTQYQRHRTGKLPAGAPMYRDLLDQASIEDAPPFLYYPDKVALYERFGFRYDPRTGQTTIHPDPLFGWPIGLEPIHWETESLPDTQAEADLQAMFAARERAWPYEMRVECLGDWSARPFQNVLIQGVHPRFQGSWQITEVEHVLSKRGYRMAIKARRAFAADPRKRLDWGTMKEIQQEENLRRQKEALERTRTQVVDDAFVEVQRELGLLTPSMPFPWMESSTRVDLTKTDLRAFGRQTKSSQGFIYYHPTQRAVFGPSGVTFQPWPSSYRAAATGMEGGYVVVMLDTPEVPEVVRKLSEGGVGFLLTEGTLPKLEHYIQKIRESSEETPSDWKDVEEQK